MEAALGWLGDMIRALLRIFPHLLICRTTLAGVFFQYGCRVLEINHQNGVRGTGLHVYWPLVTEHELVPIKRQTVNLDPQYLCTSDKKVIAVSGLFVYEVEDVVLLLTECFDYEATIRDIALASIKTVIMHHDMDYLCKEAKKVDSELTKDLRKQLTRFGVRTIRFTLSDFSPAHIHGHLGVNLEIAVPA